MITTTLRQIRQHNPCSEGWRTLLSSLGKTGADDDPLPLVTILQSNGLDDTLWCLRTITGHDKEITRFALACAQEVKHLMTDQRSLDALDAVERHLESPLSREELDQVVAAAWAAAGAAAWAAWAAARATEAAAGAAAGAAGAAGAAAGAAAWAAAGAAAWAAEAAEAAGAAEAAEAAEAADRAARARQSQIFEEIFG
jgi:hypothetical protein